MPACSIGSPGFSQPGRVGDFHRPAVQSRLDADNVAGRAGQAVDYRPLVAGNRVDQTALADIGPPGNDHLPRIDQVQSSGGVGQKFVDLLLSRVTVAGLQQFLDLLDRPSQCAVILVQ